MIQKIYIYSGYGYNKFLLKIDTENSSDCHLRFKCNFISFDVTTTWWDIEQNEAVVKAKLAQILFSVKQNWKILMLIYLKPKFIICFKIRGLRNEIFVRIKLKS